MVWYGDTTVLISCVSILGVGLVGRLFSSLGRPGPRARPARARSRPGPRPVGRAWALGSAEPEMGSVLKSESAPKQALESVSRVYGHRFRMAS